MLSRLDHVKRLLLQMKLSDDILWNTYFSSDHQYLEHRVEKSLTNINSQITMSKYMANTDGSRHEYNIINTVTLVFNNVHINNITSTHSDNNQPSLRQISSLTQQTVCGNQPQFTSFLPLFQNSTFN